MANSGHSSNGDNNNGNNNKNQVAVFSQSQAKLLMLMFTVLIIATVANFIQNYTWQDESRDAREQSIARDEAAKIRDSEGNKDREMVKTMIENVSVFLEKRGLEHDYFNNSIHDFMDMLKNGTIHVMPKQ